ncbi:MAG TPA: thioredoxin domain-containing protein [Aldersonia sp.]
MSAKTGKNPISTTSNRSTYVLGALAVLVVAVVVIGGVIWQSNRNQTRNEGYGSVSNPQVTAALQDDGAVLLSAPNAATTIDVFEDPLCPYCAQLEQSHGQELAQAIDEGRVAVRYHLLDFLNAASASGDYSTRAVAATQCVAETGDGIAYSKLHSVLFSPEQQPEEKGSADHTNADLAAMARDAGADDAAVACITDGTRVESAAADAQTARQAMAALGANGTPAVFVGQTPVDIGNNNWVADL